MKRRTFEAVARHNEAARCVMGLREAGIHLRQRDILSYWRSVERQYRMGPYRWLDRCRFARARKVEFSS